jgi:hypothetical protein
MDSKKIKNIVCYEYSKFIVEKYIEKYGIKRFYQVKHIFAEIVVKVFLNRFKNLTFDQWKEEDHPRKENGQFGKGNGSKSFKSKNKPSERHNRVKNRERKPLNISETEKAVLRDAVARNLFNDEEKENGYATRYTSQYKYTLRIEDAELLSYTPIRRWKNK